MAVDSAKSSFNTKEIDTVTNKQTELPKANDCSVNGISSLFITEEMIDAAMSKRLNMSEGTDECHSKYGNNDDDDHCDAVSSDDSSESDYHFISVSDSEDIEEEINANKAKNSKQAKTESSSVDNSNTQANKDNLSHISNDNCNINDVNEVNITISVASKQLIDKLNGPIIISSAKDQSILNSDTCVSDKNAENDSDKLVVNTNDKDKQKLFLRPVKKLLNNAADSNKNSGVKIFRICEEDERSKKSEDFLGINQTNYIEDIESPFRFKTSANSNNVMFNKGNLSENNKKLVNINVTGDKNNAAVETLFCAEKYTDDDYMNTCEVTNESINDLMGRDFMKSYSITSSINADSVSPVDEETAKERSSNAVALSIDRNKDKSVVLIVASKSIPVTGTNTITRSDTCLTTKHTSPNIKVTDLSRLQSCRVNKDVLNLINNKTDNCVIIPENLHDCSDTMSSFPNSNVTREENSSGLSNLTNHGSVQVPQKHYTSKQSTDDNSVSMTIVDDCNSDSEDGVTSNKNSNAVSNNSVQESERSNHVIFRRILPKVNYQYHPNGKIVVANNKLSKKTAALKKPNDNLCTSTEKSSVNSSSPVIIMADAKSLLRNNSDKCSVNSIGTTSFTTNGPKTQIKVNNFQQLKLPHQSQIKYIFNKVSNISDKNTTDVQNAPPPSKLVVKDLSTTSKTMTWERVDVQVTKAVPADDDQMMFKKVQLLEREVPVYKPTNFEEGFSGYSCLDCNDRFMFESSLRIHRFRKSILIKYWCRICSCSFTLYNRCMFLAHIRSHNQLIKNIDMACVTIESLPKHFIKFGYDALLDHISSANESAPYSASSTAVSIIQPQIVTTSLPSFFNSTQSTTGNTVNEKTSKVAVSTINRNPISSTKTYGNTNKIKTVTKFVSSSINETSGETCIEKDFITDDNASTKSDVISCSNSSIVGSNISTASSLDVSTTADVVHTNIPEGNKIHNVTQDVAKDNRGEINTSTVADSPKNVNAVKPKRRKCPECGLLITHRTSIRKHLQNLNRPGDESLRCSVCRLILPSQCALKMHLRIHCKAKPYRCPECAIEFHIFDRFDMHLKYRCYHLTKVIRYFCTACNTLHISQTALAQHILVNHVRMIYKCGGCPVAFINSKAIAKHMEKSHMNKGVNTVCYQQCRLCPEKLIPKKKFNAHLEFHVKDEKACSYVFQCPKCMLSFFHRADLMQHRIHCVGKGSKVSSSTGKNDLHIETIGDINAVDAAVDENDVMFSNKRSKIQIDDEPEIVTEKDPLSLEGFEAEAPLKEPRIELCVVCKKENVIIVPGKNEASQSLCCKKCVSPLQPAKFEQNQQLYENRTKLQIAKQKGYKCKICRSGNFMDLKTTYEHFKTKHRQLEGQSINEWLIIENKLLFNRKSSVVSTAENIKEKYIRKRKAINNLVQMVNIRKEIDGENGPAEKKKQKRSPKPKPKIPEKKSFERGQVINVEEAEKSEFNLNCSKCKFVAQSKDELRDHVVSHRTDPNALQCLECGECFVVMPSFEKHLIINHRITDVNSYIANNKKCTVEPEENETTSCLEETDPLACKVCYEVFETKQILNKHFRSHGLAFLLKKTTVD